MEKSCDAIPAALQFVVDDISDGESAVGVCWHLELDGKPFPFSRGVSLYRVEDGQVLFARDLVEPSAKATKRLKEKHKSALEQVVGEIKEAAESGRRILPTLLKRLTKTQEEMVNDINSL